MIIIGEKINGSIPSVAKAIAERDAAFIKARAIAQEEAGATFIDCCASVPEEVEVETLKWMIDCIQEVTDLPIAVDSPSADVLVEAYKFCNKPGLINSVSGEGDKIDKICFMGCIDSAKVDFPGWTKEDIKREVRKACDAFGTNVIHGASIGGPMSSLYGVYDAITEAIDEYSCEKFGYDPAELAAAAGEHFLKFC